MKASARKLTAAIVMCGVLVFAMAGTTLASYGRCNGNYFCGAVSGSGYQVTAVVTTIVMPANASCIYGSYTTQVVDDNLSRVLLDSRTFYMDSSWRGKGYAPGWSFSPAKVLTNYGNNSNTYVVFTWHNIGNCFQPAPNGAEIWIWVH